MSGGLLKAFDVTLHAETHKTAKNIDIDCLLKSFDKEKPFVFMLRTTYGYYLYSTWTSGCFGEKK